MKNFKYIFLSISMSLFFACDNTDLDLLDNPSGVQPENADINLLLNNVQIEFANLLDGADFPTSRLVRMNAMTGGFDYPTSFSPGATNGVWRTTYAEIIPDVGAIKNIAEGTNLTGHSGIAKVIEAYSMMLMVDLYGDVPYSEANQGINVLSPKSDEGSAVYANALELLESATTDFSNENIVAISQDVFYGGDFKKWITLTNTLKLRAYNTTRLVDSDAKSKINQIISDKNFISSASDDFLVPYSTNRSNPDSRHPGYDDFYENSDGPYIANYFLWTLITEKGLTDPRTRYYFYRQDKSVGSEDSADGSIDCLGSDKPSHYSSDMPFCVADRANGYWGRDHGDGKGRAPDGNKITVKGLYPIGGKFDDDSFKDIQNSGQDGLKGAGIFPIWLHFFTDFVLAESALTIGTDGDPRALLESGVRSSLSYVMNFTDDATLVEESLVPAQPDVDAYVSKVLDLYDDAGSDDEKLNVIMKEYYISLWGNGIEAYNNYRRTGKPNNLQPVLRANAGDFNRSLFYPDDFVSLNANATQKSITDQVFWDNNPAGFIK